MLPFAGGRDLIREYGEAREAVTNSYFTRGYTFIGLRSFMKSVFSFVFKTESFNTSSDTMDALKARGGSSVSSENDLLNEAKARRDSAFSRNVPPPILGANDPFMSTDDIAELTLNDISDLFNFAINGNRQGFDVDNFRSNLSANMKSALDAMEKAATSSRGSNVKPVITLSIKNNETKSPLSSSGFGDVDALLFCAAMRIFAEWRILRQVPENYKAYAVGMSLGQKDVVQNIAKIERAYHAWVEEKRYQQEQRDEHTTLLIGPTLRDLLQIEIDLDVHDNKLPRLKEKSTAMGLLWVRRQLMYQTSIFANINSGDYPDAVTAVAAAYSQIYGDYHGWAVQKIFNYSFKAAPPAEEIYKFMNPLILKEVTSKAKMITLTSVGTKSGLLDENETNVNDHEKDSVILASSKISEDQTTEYSDDNVTHEDDSAILDKRRSMEVTALTVYEEDATNTENPLQRLGNHIANEWGKLTTHWATEWDKVSSSIVHIFIHNPDEATKSRSVKEYTKNSSTPTGRKLSDEELEEHIATEMTRVAQEQIVSYLKVISPLLVDLDGLFNEMNMNDPTKV